LRKARALWWTTELRRGGSETRIKDGAETRVRSGAVLRGAALKGCGGAALKGCGGAAYGWVGATYGCCSAKGAAAGGSGCSGWPAGLTSGLAEAVL
jgi:hypothetical protein